jgi:hypothetical protein
MINFTVDDVYLNLPPNTSSKSTSTGYKSFNNCLLNDIISTPPHEAAMYNMNTGKKENGKFDI